MSKQASRTICVEGWRGISHSFAMVNQHQLLELLKYPNLKITHRDAPFFRSDWTRTDDGGGFSERESALINSIPPPSDDIADVSLRIHSPFPSQVSSSRKTVTFFVTNSGGPELAFDGDPGSLEQFTRDENLVVTPTNWSRDRLIEFGFNAERVQVVPHGVKTDVFSPISRVQRNSVRAQFGIEPHETVFLNIGHSMWSKGLDALIFAFSVLRQRGYPVLLLNKDTRHLYGHTTDQLLARMKKDSPGVINDAAMAGVLTFPNPMSMEHLRLLYGACDAYVSPYRAEGFNLPVLEAMACNRPVIVSAGGATDDFCPDGLARKVETTPRSGQDQSGRPTKHLEPNIDSLIYEMERVVKVRIEYNSEPTVDCAKIRDEYSWSAVTRRLVQHL